MNTCRAADASMPAEIRDAVISYVRKNPPSPYPEFLDDDWFCLCAVTRGAQCPPSGPGSCRYAGEQGQRVDLPPERRRLPLGPPLPGDETGSTPTAK
jgi:hypothetical protein